MAQMTEKPMTRSPHPLDGKGILITGGTGSFGNALVRTLLARARPSRLVIFSRDEQKQVEMAMRLSPDRHPCLRYFIGDVRDQGRLDRAMANIDYVIHAAAMKHVPVAEYNPIEAIKTNVIGAENLINAAIDNDVKGVIALSTDKAANPVNLYGATKLCADKLFLAANNLTGKAATRLAVVRYGNVIGSRGSVIPLFRRLVDDGIDRLPITDPRMTRFWITLEQGVGFVLRCLENMQGGELFVPKIPSMKLTDMIEAIAPGYPTKVVGIRPGEKLHEIMITRDDAINTIEFDDLFIIKSTGVTKLKDIEYQIDGKAGRPVAEDFEYRSDINPEWMSKDDLRALLAARATQTADGAS